MLGDSKSEAAFQNILRFIEIRAHPNIKLEILPLIALLIIAIPIGIKLRFINLDIGNQYSF